MGNGDGRCLDKEPRPIFRSDGRKQRVNMGDAGVI